MIYELGLGMFIIERQDKSEKISYIRDTQQRHLWHVCKRTPDPLVPMDFCECGMIDWDFIYGTYRCSSCFLKLDSQEVLSDGIGTGAEGRA